MQRKAKIVEAINRVFRSHNVGALAYTESKITPYKAIRTPSYIAYPVFRFPGVRIAQVVELAKEIEESLSALRNKQVKIRFGTNPLMIEVPREHPEPLVYTQADLSRLRPFEFVIGESWQAGKRQQMTLDLADSDEPHIFVAGMTGCGKTMLIESILASLMYGSSPDQVRLALVDLKGRALQPFAHLPHVLGVANNAHETNVIVGNVFDTMRKRIDRNMPASPRIVLVIDELRELKYADRKILYEYLPRIIALGREIGVHVIAATQYPLSGDIGSITKSQFPIRIVGTVSDSNVARHTTGLSRSGAESLSGKGSMLLVHNSKAPVRIQTYFLDNLDTVAQTIAAKWKGHEPATIYIPPEPQEVDSWSADLKKAKAVYEAHIDPETGHIRHGVKSAILREIRGNQVRLHGSYANLVDRLIKEIELERRKQLDSAPATV